MGYTPTKTVNSLQILQNPPPLDRLGLVGSVGLGLALELMLVFGLVLLL